MHAPQVPARHTCPAGQALFEAQPDTQNPLLQIAPGPQSGLEVQFQQEPPWHTRPAAQSAFDWQDALPPSAPDGWLHRPVAVLHERPPWQSASLVHPAWQVRATQTVCGGRQSSWTTHGYPIIEWHEPATQTS